MLPTFIFKPMGIRTKTLDSLEAKNRTNIIIARRPGHIIIDIRTKKTLDSLEAKNRTNIIARSPAKARLLDSLEAKNRTNICLLYTSPSPRDRTRSRMPSSA